jgi:hypothetical protein
MPDHRTASSDRGRSPQGPVGVAAVEPADFVAVELVSVITIERVGLVAVEPAGPGWRTVVGPARPVSRPSARGRCRVDYGCRRLISLLM